MNTHRLPIPEFCVFGWVLWLAGTFFAFTLGLAAPNPDGPWGLTAAVILLVSTTVAELIYLVTIARIATP